MTFTTSSGQRIETDVLLAKGGEGEIWTIKGDPSQVAKIYFTKCRTPERGAKIKAMVANPPKDETRNFNPPHVSIAWPTTLLYDQGDFVGYLMPRIEDSSDIFQVFNTKVRAKSSLAHFDLRYMHRVAQNFAIALHALHERGDVMGDVNQKNVLVTDTAMVTLVDTDSFQIQDGNRIFRCTVGVPDYTPPELHGLKLDAIDRSVEHDRFGLAILIFQLLMNGFHPFTGAPKDPNFSVEGGIYLYCIKNGIFPYQDNSKIKPPPQAPAITNLHPDLQALFVRCFVAGHRQPNLRPNTQDWMDALKVAEKNLVQCKKISQHWHGNHLKKCPWCAQQSSISNQKRVAAPIQNPMPGPPAPPAAPPPPITPPQIPVSPSSYQSQDWSGVVKFIAIILLVILAISILSGSFNSFLLQLIPNGSFQYALPAFAMFFAIGLIPVVGELILGLGIFVVGLGVILQIIMFPLAGDIIIESTGDIDIVAFSSSSLGLFIGVAIRWLVLFLD